MKRLLGGILLWGITLAGQPRQTDIKSTLLALKDALPQVQSASPPKVAPLSREALSNQLVDEMMALAKSDRSPSRSTTVRFSEELTGVLAGKDVTAIRAEALEKEIVDVMSGKGSTSRPAAALYETLTGFRLSDRTIQRIVDRFREIGQEIRGPDDTAIRPIKLK
jgi:hypothetical protein